MKSNYVIWDHDIVPGACSLSGMSGYADDWKLTHGLSVAAEFPSAARFAMSPDYPKQIALTDSLYNLDMQIVASERLRQLIEATQPANVEYLPVPVFNHKKRAVDQAFAIVHPTHPVDCLDVAACEPEIDPITKKHFTSVKRLVIDESRIPADRQIFRPHQFYRVILAKRSLAEAIDAAGMTGIRWVEIADYPED